MYMFTRGKTLQEIFILEVLSSLGVPKNQLRNEKGKLKVKILYPKPYHYYMVLFVFTDDPLLENIH